MPSPATRRHFFVDTPPAERLPLPKVPLLDVGRENGQLEQDIGAAIAQVTRSGRFVMGPECDRLEQRISEFCKVRHAIGCASGSDALLLALTAINLGHGDEVIVPSFTFFATASAVWRLGATPVFADIDPQTFNISPDCIRSLITANTRAILPVHLFGQPARMGEICEIAAEHRLVVIEDAAQAIGAEFNGVPVGGIGHMGCFSFYPTKNLGGFGDGGMLTTRDDDHAERLRLLRAHGMKPRYYHDHVGINSRLDTLQAAVLNVKLPNLPTWTAARAENAKRYHQMFMEAGAAEKLVLPAADENVRHVWNQYTVRVPNGMRDGLRQYLTQHGVGSEIYYPVPLHQQPCFRAIEQRTPLPETERAAREVLSLPIFPTMTMAEQETVVMRVTEYLSGQGKSSQSLPMPHVSTDTPSDSMQSL